MYLWQLKYFILKIEGDNMRDMDVAILTELERIIPEPEETSDSVDDTSEIVETNTRRKKK